MVKRLIWTDEALNNRKDIFIYWNDRNQSKSYSKKLNRLFNQNIDLIRRYPEIGMKTNNNDIFAKTAGNYQILYLSLKNSIVILNI